MARYCVFAPATIGNIGPGFDVLGLALDGFGDQISVELIKGPSRIKEVIGRDADKIPRDPNKNAAAIAALTFLTSKKMEFGVEISFDRVLPISGGLGSSAAAAVGGALAAAIAAQVPFNDREILLAALKGEEFVAGRHLDNIAPCYFGGMTIVQSIETLQVQRIAPEYPYFISVVSPKMELQTKAAREVLPTSLATVEWTGQMAMAIGLAVGMAKGDEKMVKESLVDLFAEPRRGPLIPGFDRVKEAALKLGALGCSISGAGPSVFAMSKDRVAAMEISEAMMATFLPLESSSVVTSIATRGAYLL